MSDIDPTNDPASPAAALGTHPRRAPNAIAPEPARAPKGRTAPPPDRAESDEPGGPSHRPGDAPAALTRRYFTQALRGGATLAYYEGPGSKRVAFHDHGARLTTDQTHPAVVRDLAQIAAHRGWGVVRVRGEDDFRRDLWMEGRALGLEVKGYRPTDRDWQALDRRLEAAKSAARGGLQAPGKATRAPDLGERTLARGSDAPPAPRGDRGVAGVLLEVGRAPYRRRPGGETTPFVRLDRGEGRLLEIWGAGLADALARSGARRGDAVHVRRDGVDVIGRPADRREPGAEVADAKLNEITRSGWVIEADRFRRATPAQAARDETLRGAQSHLRVLDSVIDQAVQDPQRRARLHAEARELVARELAQGRRFPPARIREIEPVIARDVGQARRRDRPGDPSPDRAPMR